MPTNHTHKTKKKNTENKNSIFIYQVSSLKSFRSNERECIP
jgi:hypothetical protein